MLGVAGGSGMELVRGGKVVRPNEERGSVAPDDEGRLSLILDDK